MGLLGRSKGKLCLVSMLAVVFGASSLPWMSMPLASPAEMPPNLRYEETLAPDRALNRQIPLFDAAQLKSLQQGLDVGTLIVAFQVGPLATEVSLIDGQDVEVETLSIGHEELASLVDLWISYILEAGHPETVFFTKFDGLAEHLYAELLSPFEGRIATSDRVVFIPDGPLHRLPFSCLKRLDEGKIGQYFVQWKPFQTAPSVGDYLQVMASGGAALHRSSRLAAFGDADFGSAADIGDASGKMDASKYRGPSNLSSIPGSGDEVRSIASAFPLHRLFLGKDATKDQLKNLHEVDVLHLSTHAVQASPRTGGAALLLSPKRLDGRPVMGSERLEMFEILRGDVPKAKLVVLSACDSALGDRLQESRGNGQGLGWAFLESGSQSVVSSLWKVDDLHTVELMQRFYLHLGSGLPQGEALQKAQVDLIEGHDLAAQAPRNWAAFQMQGHWR